MTELTVGIGKELGSVWEKARGGGGEAELPIALHKAQARDPVEGPGVAEMTARPEPASKLAWRVCIVPGTMRTICQGRGWQPAMSPTELWEPLAWSWGCPDPSSTSGGPGWDGSGRPARTSVGPGWWWRGWEKNWLRQNSPSRDKKEQQGPPGPLPCPCSPMQSLPGSFPCSLPPVYHFPADASPLSRAAAEAN